MAPLSVWIGQYTKEITGGQTLRELYLAVPHRTYKSTFQDELGQILLQNELLRLIVFDEDKEVIIAWIPS